MRRIAIMLLMLLAAAASCKRSGQEVQYKFSRTYRSGPVSLRVALSDSAVTIADKVHMLIETRAEKGWRAELPRFGDKLSEFGIVDYTTPRPALEDKGAVVTRRVYVLEPFLSGDYKIPPMEASFVQEGDTTRHAIESDTIVVSVKSLLPKAQASLDIHDVAAPVPFPFPWWKAALAAACVAAAAGAAVFLWRHRRIREKLIPRLPAHEIAYRKLERLLSRGLIEQKLYREFTAGVADILRQYIEDRFALRAPERTTEEFLVEAGMGLPVDREHKGVLKQFLVHCDLVKFAALEPSADDVKRTFETCKEFIEMTKVREEVKAEAAASPA
jgi:hypothetical protein